MSILFINGSPNKNGNTVRLTKKFLKDQEFKTLNLVDYKIYSYGQNFEDDQLDEVIEQMKQADTIVIGSPLYWHSMSGAVRNVLDRFYGYVDESLLRGKDMYFVFQGYAPTKEQLAAGEYTMSRLQNFKQNESKNNLTNEMANKRNEPRYFDSNRPLKRHPEKDK